MKWAYQRSDLCQNKINDYAKMIIKNRPAWLLRSSDSNNWHIICALADAFGQNPEKEYWRKALIVLAKTVLSDFYFQDNLSLQEISNLANAFSKYLKNKYCNAALEKIASLLKIKPNNSSKNFLNGYHYGMKPLTCLISSFAREAHPKLFHTIWAHKIVPILISVYLRVPEKKYGFIINGKPVNFSETYDLAEPFLKNISRPQCREVLKCIATGIVVKKTKSNRLNITGLDATKHCISTLTIEFSKFCEDEDRFRKALLKIIKCFEITKADSGVNINGHHFNLCETANLVNAISKYPDKFYVVKSLGQFAQNLKVTKDASKTYINGACATSQCLFDLTNAFSKYSQFVDCKNFLIATGWKQSNGLDNKISKLDRYVYNNELPPSTVFDYNEVFEQFGHKPSVPPKDAGLTNLQVYDIDGKLIRKNDRHYTILGRLTKKKLPLVRIALPQNLKRYQLESKINIDGKEFRFELFGGNLMKPKTKKVKDLIYEGFHTNKFNDNKQISHKYFNKQGSNHGMLPAVPVEETKRGSDFEDLTKKLFPNKESFYYFNRMMTSAPSKNICAKNPTGYVLEGQFNLALLPDRSENELHSFYVKTTVLRPHDGCGFIKASLAKKITILKSGKIPPIRKHKKNYLPCQALQHYKSDNEVVKETVAGINDDCVGLNDSNGVESLYRKLTGGIECDIAIAVPSGDNCVHLPYLKGQTFQTNRNAGIILGRAPYDKKNIFAIEKNRVKLLADNDQTAIFLNENSVIQYTFVAQDRTDFNKKEFPLFFTKGLLVVVPDDLWPADFKDNNVVMSAQDVKTHTDWTKSKMRVTADTSLLAQGILQAIKVYPPGSCAAIPLKEQDKMDGDFDGDCISVVAGRPCLFNHVKKHSNENSINYSLKPDKSFTKAIDNKQAYHFSRSRQIMETRSHVLETFSDIQGRFLAQPLKEQSDLASRIVNNAFRGLPKGIKEKVSLLLFNIHMLDNKNQHIAQLRPKDLKFFDETDEKMFNFIITLLNDYSKGKQVLSLECQKEYADYRKFMPRLDLNIMSDSRSHLSMLQTLLRHLPEQKLDYKQVNQVYVKNDPLKTVHNLLIKGIKIGTDAYKSDTGINDYFRLSLDLKNMFDSFKSTRCAVPYRKALAYKLASKTFKPDKTIANLENNPTLAGQIMKNMIEKFKDQINIEKAMVDREDN
ncbi:MAG: hypothetical protein GY874_06795 [Desulfobacteraceae bacterium]|nr:hypothetical protein [Desulfobacteraceae bacterium]